MGKDYVRPAARAWPRLGERELAFLLACAQAQAPPSSPAADLDWPTLTGRLISDGLAPLVYHHFRHRPDELPPAVLAACQHAYYQNTAANHLRLEELRRMGRSLAALQPAVPLLALKGAALALTVYPDPALRFMGDLDVAVPPQQTRPALQRLQEDGCQLHEEESGGLEGEALLHEQGWHLRMARQVWGKTIELELHWPLRRQVLVSQVAMLDVDHLWQQARPLDAAHNLWQPAPAATLLYLCLHTGLQHRFTDLGLRHYMDLDRLVRHAAGEVTFWRDFVAQARRARAAHVSYFCLRLAATMLGTPVPAGVLGALRPPAWKQAHFARRLPPEAVLNRTRALYDRQRVWWRLLTADRPADLIGGPWHTLFPGRQYLASYYDRQGLMLAGYALWHPIHALARAGRRRLGELRARRANFFPREA